MTKTLGSYDVPTTTEPMNYSTVCGRVERPTNAPSITGSHVLDQFKTQIGCPEVSPLNWAERRGYYREQFEKAKQCFHGRVSTMGRFTAETEEDERSRQGHAHAAQAAYVVGRNCLRKFANIPGAEERFTTSAQSLITDVNAIQPGVKAALNTALETSVPLQTLYTETYGLTPDQWDIYRKFLQYTAIKASNYHRGEAEVAAVARNFNAIFRPSAVDSAPVSNVAAPAPAPALYATGGAGTTTVNTSTEEKKAKEAAILSALSPTPLPTLKLLTPAELLETKMKYKTIDELIKFINMIFNMFNSPAVLSKLLEDPKRTLKTFLLPFVYITTHINFVAKKFSALNAGGKKLEDKINSLNKTHRLMETTFYKEIIVPINKLMQSFTPIYKKFMGELLPLHEQTYNLITAKLADTPLADDFATLNSYVYSKTYFPEKLLPLSTLLLFSWKNVWPQLDNDDNLPELDNILILFNKAGFIE